MAKQTVSYSKLAAALLPLVGGAENVRAVTHCMTRLRLELADESRADTDAIKALDGVSAVVQQSGQYQIVIGPAVNEVFNAFLPLVSTTDASGVPAAPVKKNWKYYGNKVLDYITSSITPLIGVLVGAGLIEALASILVTFGALDAASSTYTVLYQIGYTGLYFLPVLVPLKRPLFACALSCGITGFVEGMLHVTRYTPGPAGLGTLAIFVKEPSDLVRVIAVGILAFVLSFVLTRLFGFENMRSGLKK